jgi:hypothetical protein
MNTNYRLIGALTYTLEHGQLCVGARQAGEVQEGRGDVLTDTRTKGVSARKGVSFDDDKHLLPCPPTLEREAMPRFAHSLLEGLVRIAEESWLRSPYHSSMFEALLFPA